MGIEAKTDKPKALLVAIYIAIADGSIETWEKDDDGDILHAVTMNNVQEAWFRPTPETSRALEFKILSAKGESLSAFSYAYHHGKLVQMLLHHFAADVSSIEATMR